VHRARTKQENVVHHLGNLGSFIREGRTDLDNKAVSRRIDLDSRRLQQLFNLSKYPGRLEACFFCKKYFTANDLGQVHLPIIILLENTSPAHKGENMPA